MQQPSCAFETALSTFGVGREFSPAGWRDLIDQLRAEGERKLLARIDTRALPASATPAGILCTPADGNFLT